MADRPDCWESMRCGRGPGGVGVARDGLCPAAAATALDGLNGGRAAGRACWLAAGTLCGGKIRGDFAQKFQDCLLCPQLARVRSEEGDAFNLGIKWLREHGEAQRADEVVEALALRFSEMAAARRAVEAGARFQTMGELIAGISHELCSPLQYVHGNLDFLREAVTPVIDLLASLGAHKDRLPAEVRERLADADVSFFAEEAPAAVAQCLDGLERMNRLIVAVKRSARTRPTERQPTSVGRLFEEVVLVCRHEWRYHATVDLQIAPDLPMVPVFDDELRQVLINLVVNASQAIASQRPRRTDGHIVLSAELRGDWIQMQVADDGPGIPQELHAKVFDRYFTTKANGTGQGLTLCREVVEDLHGGGLRIISQDTPGTTVHFELPLSPMDTPIPRVP